MTVHKHGVAGEDFCYTTPGELEQARKDAAAIKAMRALLSMCAAGRSEYAANAPDAAAEILNREAATLESALAIINGDSDTVRAFLPSWRWAAADSMLSVLRPVAALGGDPE
jgi:hypothetical protein